MIKIKIKIKIKIMIENKVMMGVIEMNILTLLIAAENGSKRNVLFNTSDDLGLTATRTLLHPHPHDATLPNTLNRAGYRTGIVGKRHVDLGASFQFDSSLGNDKDALDASFHERIQKEIQTRLGTKRKR